MWKLLSGIFSDKVYNHLLENHLLPDEQKGCRRRSRGTKDQLLIDRRVMQEAKRLKKNVAMAWVDYKKAYDMVPHSWVTAMLEWVGVADNIRDLMVNSMKKWKTTLSSNGKDLGEVNIKRGIFQGDSFSPLLFIISMLPLTFFLRASEIGFRFSEQRKTMNHLFFMDDLKVYGKDEKELEVLLTMVKSFSDDIKMSFGLDKCRLLVMKGGTKVKSEGIVLPGDQHIKEIDEKGYKYLGVLQGEGIMVKEMKDKIKGEYCRRVRLLAKSKLYGGNMVKGINAWGVSVLHYTAGIIEWTKKELKEMDIKTRKILTMAGAFHMRGDVDRLYIQRKNGGRGLISVEDCVRKEERSLATYVKQSKEWMLCVISKEMESDESGKEYSKRRMEERKQRLDGKNVHGRYLKDMETVGCNRTWQWLQGGYLNKCMEGFIMAAQEQALRTRWYRSCIQKEDVDEVCRVCGKGKETVRHLTSACEVLSKGPFKRRHDAMGRRIYWELCGNYGIHRTDKWFQEVPDAVRSSEDNLYEIWWDIPIQTTVKLEHYRPDLVILNRVDNECTIVDFSVPWEENIYSKEEQKITNYTPLAREMSKMHRMSTKIVPIVLGGLGTVPNSLLGNLTKLNIPDIIGGLQTTVLISTHNMLRKVLSSDAKEKRDKKKGKKKGKMK